MENGNAVRKKSGSASKKGKREERKVIQLISAEEEPVVCQRRMDMKKIEETQDCFILGFDPFHSDDAHLSAPSVTAETADLLLVSQKGQVVACRDYPHSRHQCVEFPFQKTPHERYCQLCYCYVCDSAAPCKYWTDPDPDRPGHCHATAQDPQWKLQRKEIKDRVTL